MTIKNKINKSIKIVACVSLLNACMLGPDYEQPIVDVPDAWYQGEGKTFPAHDDEAALLAELNWWELFHDETLKELIQLALENNRDLKTAVLNIDKARAAYRIERSGLFPSANLLLESEREGLSLLEDGTDDIVENHYLAVDLSWELDLWGAVRRKNEAALADYLATGYGWRSVRLSLISDVATAYFSLLGADEKLKINLDTLKARESAYIIADKRFKGGLTSKLEVQQAKVELASARAAVPDAEQSRLAFENTLSILLDVNPREYLVKTNLGQQHIPKKIKPGLPSNLLQRRPDIMQAEQSLRIASEKVGVAKAAFFPSLTLTTSLGYETAEFEDLLDSDGEKWIVAGNLLTPIFNAGRLDAQYTVAQIELKQAKLAYEQSVLQSMREVSDALKQFYKNKDVLQAHLELEVASREYYILAMKRYRLGILAYLDVLDAQRKLLDAQLKVSDSREKQLQSVVALYKSLGGGWDGELVAQTDLAQKEAASLETSASFVQP